MVTEVGTTEFGAELGSRNKMTGCHETWDKKIGMTEVGAETGFRDKVTGGHNTWNREIGEKIGCVTS